MRKLAAAMRVTKPPERQDSISRPLQFLRYSLLGDAGRVLALSAGGYIMIRIALGLLHLN
ncbi:MAG: hypothetical protein V4527_16955 [Pseudomonadota bacterium]